MSNLRMLLATGVLTTCLGLPLGAQQPQTPGNPQPATPGAREHQAAPAPESPTGQGAPDPQSSPQTTAPAVPVTSTANAPEVTNSELRPVTGELVSKLDSKSAKPGDSIVVKTTEKATIGDGLVIPKGSKIVGHVTEVQAHDGSNQNAKVTVQFDQAELKGGQSIPIKSVLQSVSPAAGADNAGADMGASPAPMSAPGSGTASTGGGAVAGGSSVPQTAAPAQGSSAGVTASANGNASNGAPAEGTIVARQGNIVVKTTAIPNVLIAANANGQPFSNASGALLGARQNVHLDGGTHVVLAVADASAKGTNTR